MTCRPGPASWLLLSLVTGIASLGLPLAAQGQVPAGDRSFSVQLFEPGMGPRPYFTLDGAKVPPHLELSLWLASNYQRNPFTLSTLQGPTQVEEDVEVVRDQITTELVAAIGLGGKFQLGLAVPVHVFQKGEDFTATGVATGEDLKGASVGDLRVEGKYEALTFGGNNEFTLALIPGLTIPTGDAEKFTGDRNVTGRLKVLTEMQIGEVRAAAMLGGLFRQPSENFAATIGQMLLYGLGVDYRVHRDVSIIGELAGRSGLDSWSKFYKDANPLEGDVGMRIGLPKMLSLTVGGGLGIVRGIGAPKYRGFLALGWSPNFGDADGDGVYDYEDRCSDSPEDVDGHRDGDGCPDLDNDGDGLLDPQDKCALVAEDADQYQDDDGCPEPDNDGDNVEDLKDPCPNAKEDGRGKRPTDGCPSSAEDQDGDGVPDGSDRCNDEPEDRDGYEDEDGCPEADNDNDSIPDNFDECPTEAEDADGVDDADGCPDPDNDKDGFDDAQDRCPAEPETLNGNRDDDGCKDAGAELVTLADESIQLRERISFSGGATPTLTRASQTLVNLVALVMKGHRELSLVRVEVHADGAAAEQTQARADAVVAFLVSKGVDAKRLKAVGAGAGGNRVDFIIEQRSTKREKAPPNAPVSP